MPASRGKEGPRPARFTIAFACKEQRDSLRYRMHAEAVVALVGRLGALLTVRTRFG